MPLPDNQMPQHSRFVLGSAYILPKSRPRSHQGGRSDAEIAKVTYFNAGQNAVCAGCDVAGDVQFRDLPTRVAVEAGAVAVASLERNLIRILVSFAAQIWRQRILADMYQS